MGNPLPSLGWKRPLSPTVNLTLPTPLLNHVPKPHVCTSFKDLQGWGHDDSQCVALIQGKARAHKQNDAHVSSVWVLLNPCGVLPSQEEIQEVKEEGNLEVLFNSLDKIVEEAKDHKEPAWYGIALWKALGERACVWRGVPSRGKVSSRVTFGSC